MIYSRALYSLFLTIYYIGFIYSGFILIHFLLTWFPRTYQSRIFEFFERISRPFNVVFSGKLLLGSFDLGCTLGFAVLVFILRVIKNIAFMVL